MSTWNRSSRVIPWIGLAFAVVATGCGGGGEGGEAPESVTPPPSSAEAEAPPPSTPASAAVMGGGSVAGQVVFDGQPPRLKPLSMDADPGCVAMHEGDVAPEMLVLGEGQALANVFVQVKNPPEGTYAPPADPAIIDQRGCLYVPHVLGVVAGQTVQFRNSDGLLHNVHGLPTVNREFNLGMPPSVTETDVKLNRPEPVFPVKCDVHPWMRSYVAVLEHPFFAVSDETGQYQIEGLPAGTYEIEAWHERLGIQNASVTIADDETGSANFTFSVPGGS